jgi:hypothetical protein
MKKSSFWGGLISALKSAFTKEALLSLLKDRIIKFALKRILGAALMSTFWGWLAKFLFEELYEEVFEPFLRFGLNKLGYYTHKSEGKLIIEKIREAREEGNEQDYDHAIDDLFND